MASQTVDFGIVVALPIERDAVVGRFSLVKSAQDARTYYVGQIATGNDGYTIAATMLPHMGNLEAALATSDLIRIWQPRRVLVIGIAGGARPDEQALGDVAVSEQVYYYEEQKLQASGIEFRPRILPADRVLYDRALNFSNDHWTDFIQVPPPEKRRPPKVFFGPIASGEKVVKQSDFLATLRGQRPKLIAIDMESAGAAAAALSSLAQIGFVSIRGISDFADQLKNDDWQAYAAHSAAAWTYAFLCTQPVPASRLRLPSPSQPTKPCTLDRRALFDAIRNRFDLEEFRTLCFMLGIDFDDLRGEGKQAKVRELILLFERREQIDVLAETITNLSALQ